MADKKNKHRNGNEHIAIYLCTKFQSIFGELQILRSNLPKKYE